jgi:serine/threonine-protein kinase
MTDDVRILRLLENLMDTGSSPEEVCSECPELLPEVREQWNQCQKVNARLDALFAPSEPSIDGGLDEHTAADIHLPQIPGYEVTGVQGRGGMGIVYRALHLQLNRTIALKMLLSGAYSSAIERARFRREARAAAGLQHANIVRIFDVGEFEGRPFFTMELLEGKTLAEYLAGNPLPAAQAVAMMSTLADAVESAHRFGIVHRDLKPANVLLTTGQIPKISDFGLARRIAGEDALTVSGARVGTPSYMSPEQALGKAGTIGPATDIYSLGAIFYEMLTGRPPFRGESAAETQRQLLAEDSAQPSKLNARVPRDLETICLKCLAKDPRRRYSTAAAIAEDLQRFERNEPISARRTGAIERAVKWTGRHPAMATALLSASLIAIALIAATSWMISQRAATTRVAEDELRAAINLQQQSMWNDANAALDRAAFRLGSGGSADLRGRLEHARRDSELAARLDAIRLDRAGSSGGVMNFDKAERDYRKAFLDWGIGAVTDSPSLIAERIKRSNARAELVAAVYDWMLSPNTKLRDRLWEIARLADHDPTGWRDGIHSPEIWGDGNTLLKMADTAPLTDQSVPFLLAIAYRLEDFKQNAVPFLTKVQDAYPQDFWVNLTLADDLKAQQKASDAIPYYKAAIALRPMAAVVHNNLGMLYDGQNRTADAIAEFRRALKIDPRAYPSQHNLANALYRSGNYAEAITVMRDCLETNPADNDLQLELGQSLLKAGRADEAFALYRKLIDKDPKFNPAQRGLRTALIAKGRPLDAMYAWITAININGYEHETWDGFAEYCL